MTVGTPDKLFCSIIDPFQLTKTDVGRLFGVSRQAVSEWERAGIPAARQGKAAAVAAIGELLTRKLKAERIPGVARRPAAAYDGLTMLEMIELDRHEELLELTRRSFDWARLS